MKIFFFIASILINVSVCARNSSEFFTKADAFFSNHVENGLIHYQKIKENPESLEELLHMAAEFSVSDKDPKTYQAFYINAYNLAVIKGIIENYPTKSPLDIKGFFDKRTYKIAGKETTLNDLENKLLRKVFPTEARFHFALVCAGLGCPPIINEAYTPEKLEQQLQRQTEIALNNPQFIKVQGNKVQLSQIFEWYKEDFIHEGSEIDYINQFRKDKIPSTVKVSYYPYDWTLNDMK